MSDRRSILLRMEDEGHKAARIRLKGTDRDETATERYEILGEIARGGVGLVHRGRDNDIGRDVALKVLRDDLLKCPELVQRFVEEAQIGGQLQHPGIVPVYELGLQADQKPFFAMKLVKGETLAARLAKRADPSEGRRALLAVFREVCRTMAYAHARGVIHRDLKPSNIMIGNFSEVQVVDWGFAKVMRRGGVADEGLAKKAQRDITMISTVRSGEGSEPSVAGSVMGTPAYMPPEQALGRVEDLDERGDIFSLGGILCEILTGNPPYCGDDRMSAATMALLEPTYARLDSCGADQRLTDLCKRCLQPLPKDRPASAETLADEVAAFITSVEGRAHRAQVRALKAAARAAEQRRARRFTTLVGTGIVLVLAIATGAFFRMDAAQANRARERSAAIEAALQDASLARAAGRWPAALAAVDRAAKLGYDGDLGKEIRAQADRNAAQRRRLREEGELLDGLKRARSMTVDHDDAGAVDATYAAAVHRLWPDLEVDARRLRDSVHALEFAAAFDAWAELRRQELEDEDWRPMDAWARAIDPEHDALRDSLASEDPEALDAFLGKNECIELPPATIANIGDVLGSEGRERQGVALLQRAYRRYPGDYWINVVLGRVARKTGQFEVAVRHCLAALAIQPDSVEARHYLGIALEEAGDLDGAIAVWRDGMRLKERWGHGLGHIAEALVKQGKSEEALRAFAEAVRLAPDDARIHYSRGHFLSYQLYRLDEALESFKRAVELKPEEPAARDSIPATLIRMGELEGARVEIEKILAVDPDDVRALTRLSVVLSQTGETDRAIQVSLRVTDLAPENPAGYASLGALMYDKGEVDEAIKYCRKAIELDPDSVAGLHHLGQALVGKCRQGQASDELWGEAIAAMRKAIALEPMISDMHNDLGVGLLYRGKPAEAVECFTRAIELTPNAVEYHSNLLSGCTNAGTPEKAVEPLRRLAERLPESSETERLLGTALVRSGDYRDGVEHLERAIELNPNNVMAYTRLGRAHFLRGDPKDALVPLHKAVKLAPGHLLARASLGVALFKTGDLDGAIAHFRRAAELSPGNWDVLGGLAQALEENGDFPDALAAWKKVARLNPRFGIKPGAFLCDTLCRYDEAIEYFRGVLAKDPGNRDALYCLAVAHRKKGENDEAVQLAKRLIDLEPNSARTFNIHGEALEWSGELEAAATAYGNGLELEPTHRALRNKLSRVESMLAIEKRLEEPHSFSAAERLAAAQLGFVRNRFAESARLYREALADPALAEPAQGHLFEALGAAALAGGEWHETALEWARTLYAWRVETPPRADQARFALRFRAEPNFAPVRDVDELSEDWRAFWADVDALLEKSGD